MKPVEQSLELAGFPAERAVCVGDTMWDMRAGSRAGVCCPGVLCGRIPRGDLEAAGAEAVYDDPAHFLAALSDSPWLPCGKVTRNTAKDGMHGEHRSVSPC